MIALIDSFVQFVLALVASWGYGGIVVLMTIESTIIPFPAELILIPAGALVAQGSFSGPLVLAAAIIGSVLGALINYALAYYLGRKSLNLLISRYGRFLLIDEKAVLKTESYFARHGHITTFVGRLIPGIRSFISLPAGFARMNLFEFSVFTALGAGLWSALLIALGFFLGENYEAIRSQMKIITVSLIIIGSVIIWAYLKRKKRLA